jgi:phenylalanyl-tRNA synthetase beta chain
MIISVNWLKKFTDIDLPIDELATLIGARLVEIEEIIDLGAKYQDVIVARVMEAKKHEGSDHLNITKLDDGGRAQGVERDENGYVQVVCGAPNVREGLTVAWLPPGATVPDTFGTSEPFVLGTRTLRGVVSNGMIASPRELALSDEHDGILELDELESGMSFAKAYELDDYLLDIENKSLTHRPDCFGIVGFAREVAAIQSKEFHTPDWLKVALESAYDQDSGIKAPTVTIDDPALSGRYQAIVLAGIKENATSSLLIQTYLSRVGVRPISAVVDVTNYLMMLTGQPLHAFDYDKLVAVGGTSDIHVRTGREDEKLTLLDGRKISLTPDDIVIAAGEKAVALAGAMGGAETEIDKNTKTIILESATFNLYNLRATQMRHGIFSEAITRFTKGQPAELTAPVLHEAVRLLSRDADARAVTSTTDSYPGKHEPQTVIIQVGKINQALGSQLSTETIESILQNVEFKVTTIDGTLHVTPPYWRDDIHIAEDIIEEIGRLNGFDNIEPRLPTRDFTAVRPSAFDMLRTKIRRSLTRAGANEVLTYSFVHGDMLERAEQRPEESYRITNSISPSLQYYRQSLTPNLLGLVHANIKQGYDDFALYELNKVHPKSHGLTDESVPYEVDMLAMTVASKHSHQGAPYYQAKKMLDNLGRSFGLELVYLPLDTDPNYPETAPFEFRRSAMVTDRASGALLGIVGEYKKSVMRGFKLPEYAAGFELSTRALETATRQSAGHYAPLSRYPGTDRDICFQVKSDVAYYEVASAMQTALDETELETTLSPVDIYQADGATTKNITVRIRLTSHVKTLTGEEVAPVINTVIKAVQARTNATVL